MSYDRTVWFEVGGNKHALCFTHRALRALQEKHGLKTALDLHQAMKEPIGLEGLLHAGLEGFCALNAPATKVPVSVAVEILDALPVAKVRDLVDEALVLAFLGPKEEEGKKEAGDQAGKATPG